MSDERVYMLNVLWFRPDGGEAKYREYLRAAWPIAARYGGRKLDSYKPEQALIGEFDADLVFMMEWPNWEKFNEFLTDPDYQEVRGLRELAIRDSLLVRCRAVN
jgi:uncharacterized protein (DUF1330 family)